ncbi:MAG: DUF4393 domain-containing protein [Pseudomonadota bacterium]
MSEDGNAISQVAVEAFKTAYEDAFAPAAKQVGKAGDTLGRAVNVALMPVQAVVWSFEQIGEYVKAKVFEKLEKRKTSPEDVQVPDPDIAVPSVEALRYSKMKDEFANLLASSMDKNSAAHAHPSFVEILKQITPDEAKVLRQFQHPLQGLPFITLRLVAKNGGHNDFPGYLSRLAQDSEIDCPSRFSEYIDNLVRLRLISIPPGQQLNDDKAYKALEELPTHLDKAIGDDLLLKKLRGVFHLTQFGFTFRRICID